ncbi:UNVERIFIED_ORG: hypothetical protein ABID33_000525 [Xanthobacter viscosus]|uniref:Uncharacterized protein n=1 Tax=Xanthobacter autotrophicus TaxID=280 RepID=A0A6C1KH47_XANAU|nr:hypothetical protein [Xanthobacter autotrophicus]TLX43609.1 hypothetical protein FBQ73_05690 [Xanthobacter autotrophicus]
MAMFSHSQFGPVANLYILPGAGPLTPLIRRALESTPNLQIVVFGDAPDDVALLPMHFDSSVLDWAFSVAAEAELCEPDPPFLQAIEAGVLNGARHPRKLTIRAPERLHLEWKKLLLEKLAGRAAREIGGTSS